MFLTMVICSNIRALLGTTMYQGLSHGREKQHKYIKRIRLIVNFEPFVQNIFSILKYIFE